MSPCAPSRLFALLAVLSLGLAGCANMPMTRTGFLPSYDSLQAAPERTVGLIPDGVDAFVSERLSGGARYDSVLIDPVEYRQAADAPFKPTQERSDDLSAYFGRKLHAILGEELEVVDSPRAGTVRVRAAITAIEKINLPLNIVTGVLFVPVDMGGVSGEIELLDATSGEQLAALTLYREGTIFLFIECFNEFGHVRHSMKKWARMVRSMIAGD